MSKPSTDVRGRRYSAPERVRIIRYIEEHNRREGRGGQRAAHRKFGIAQLTLKNWMTFGIYRVHSGSPKLGKVGRTLDTMQALLQRIEAKELALTRLNARYERLKREI